MKIYSNEAVTSTAVNELDAKQTEQINKLKQYVIGLLIGEVVILAIALGAYAVNH